MSKKKQDQEVLEMNRFVIRKSLIGKGKIISFTNKEGEKWVYNHDEVYEAKKDHFDNMACFQRYGNYTATLRPPVFARKMSDHTPVETK